MGVRLIQDDCLSVLPTLEASSIDAVVTDPPWGMDWNQDSTRYTGGNRALRPPEGRDDWHPIAGDDQPFDPTPWLDFPKVVLWGYNHFAGRLPVGTTLVWIKKASHLFGTFLSDAEVAWMKGGHGVFCFGFQFPPLVRIKQGNGAVTHPNQKPVELMMWCLEKLNLPAGATVLDPYMGSGTTGVACLRMGLNFIGIECEPSYFATARKRLEKEDGRYPLFEHTSVPVQQEIP